MVVKPDKPIDGSAQAIFSNSSDKYRLNIVVDDWGFQRNGTNHAGDT